MDTYGRWPLIGCFIDSSLIDGGTNRDFGKVVAQGGSTVYSKEKIAFSHLKVGPVPFGGPFKCQS